jgi:hypothetical protein
LRQALRCVSALALALWLCGGAHPALGQPEDEAAAQWPLPDAVAISWENLDAEALAAFERGPGLSGRAEVAALSRQGGAVAGRWQSVNVNHWGEVGEVDGGVSSGDQILTATVTASLGDTQAAMRTAIGAQADEATAALDDARWHFISQAQDAYLAWWVAEATGDHLEHYINDARSQLAPLREAVASQTLSAFDLYDLEVEVAWLDAEWASTARAAADARADLQAHLGVPVALSVEGMPDLDEHTAAPQVAEDLSNPWRALQGALDNHPHLNAIQRRADALRAQAHAAQESNPWTVSAGAGLRIDEAAQPFGALTVGVTVPLSHPGEAPAALYEGHAAAADAERVWALTSLRAQLDAEAQRFDALALHQRTLSDRWWVSLEARQAALEDALKRGLVDRARVIRARRDLHECVHERLMLRAALTAHAARARALRRLLTELQP